jgi:hypothetical protein
LDPRISVVLKALVLDRVAGLPQDKFVLKKRFHVRVEKCVYGVSVRGSGPEPEMKL